MRQYFCLCWLGDGEPLFSPMGELCEKTPGVTLGSWGQYRTYDGEVFRLPERVIRHFELSQAEVAKLWKESYTLPHGK